MHTVTDPQMEFHSIDAGTLPATVNVSRFQGRNGVTEVHLVVRPTESAGIDVQLDWLYRAYRKALDSLGIPRRTVIWRRLFCSDLSNQVAALEARPFSCPRNSEEPCAISWVCQPPVAPARVELWAYHISDATGELDKVLDGTTLTVRRGELRHHWTTGLACSTVETPHDQTRMILVKYEAFLRERGMSLADHTMRTWFFVQNIDANYKGFVAARREFFAQKGLTPETHFIASTGIEGAGRDLAARVVMDAYAIEGVRREQIRYLAAPEHLSPTHVYGVTFERGTAIAYRDRQHVIVSGTASIDHQGKTLHPGDVQRQLERMRDHRRHGGEPDHILEIRPRGPRG